MIDQRGHGELLTVDVVDAEGNQTSNVPVTPRKKNLGVRFIDDEEEGVAYKSLVGDASSKRQKMVLMNTDKAKTVKGAIIKLIFTEDSYMAKTASMKNPTSYYNKFP